MTEPAKLLVATNNPGKLREYTSLLAGRPFNLVTLADAGIVDDVEETGSSMDQNAIQKATIYSALGGLITLADDSGLEVDALGGEPGRLSARYAGENATDKDRVEYLLKRMNGVPWENRTARFRCVIAMAAPDGKVELCAGECPGFITFEPRGEHGFGYDPIFYLPELDKTMAELPLAQKNKISHRGQAARKAAQTLRNMVS